MRLCGQGSKPNPAGKLTALLTPLAGEERAHCLSPKPYPPLSAYNLAFRLFEPQVAALSKALR